MMWHKCDTQMLHTYIYLWRPIRAKSRLALGVVPCEEDMLGG